MSLKICFAASEIVPFAKTGGLADVSASLCKFLKQCGHDIRIFMPLYNTIDLSSVDFQSVDFVRQVPIDCAGHTFYFSLHTANLPHSSARIYFVDCPQLYHRNCVYSQDHDEYLRFAFFSQAVIKSCQHMGWGPNIFHCNDWQTALIPLYLKTLYRWDSLLDNSRTVLTIHNIGYQGVFAADAVSKIGLGNYYRHFPEEDIRGGIVNYLKTGIIYADAITTVSETYSREIQSPEYGAGLDGLLRSRADKVIGIVNGVDYEEWSPEHDKHLHCSYSLEDLSGKEKNKKWLLGKVNIPYDEHAPVLGIVSRLASQKGFELLEPFLFPMLARENIRLLVLGAGEERYTRLFESAEHYFPQKVRYHNGINNPLAHLIEAASDMFLMPSSYEPCGLNQIYSMRYGTPPIVRKTGGLADTIVHWDSPNNDGTGFVFEHYTANGLSWAIKTALRIFHNKETWHRIMLNGMIQDYSWKRQGGKYVALYHWLLQG